MQMHGCQGRGAVEWGEQAEEALGGSKVSLWSNERVLELENRMFVEVDGEGSHVTVSFTHITFYNR